MLPIGTRVRVLPGAVCVGEKAKPGAVLTIVDHFDIGGGYHTDDGSQWWTSEVEAVYEHSMSQALLAPGCIPFPSKRKHRNA